MLRLLMGVTLMKAAAVISGGALWEVVGVATLA